METLILDSPDPVFDGGKECSQNNGSENNMNYHQFRNPPERHDRSVRSETFLYSPTETLNIGYMFLLGQEI